MADIQQPTPPAGRARTAGELQQALDARSLALASFAAVLGGIVASAFGGSPLATLVCAAISPWITAFLTHPGPRRVRRGAAVLLLALLIAGCRNAVAAVRRSAPGGRGKRRDGVAPAGASPREGGGRGEGGEGTADLRHTRAWLREVAVTAVISLPLAVATVTAVEALRGEAFAADRRTTFFGGARPVPTPTATPTPTPTPTATAATEPGKPIVRVPGTVVARAGDRAARRITYNVSATDAAGNPLLPVCRPPSGAQFALGKTRVDCAATDRAGRRAEASFVVSVRPGGGPQAADDARPKLTVPADFTHDASSASGARVTYAASARDARDGALTPVCRPRSGSRFALGRTDVVCTARDAAGNTARAGFVVTVVRALGADHTSPEITMPGPLETTATSAKGATVRYDVATTDNRDGALEARCDPRSSSVFAIGPSTVSCVATDRAGNKATESFTVTVVDGPPVLHLPGPIERVAANEKGAKVTYDARATDAVDGPLKPTCDPRSGRFFTIGSRDVTCKITDSNGGADKGTFTLVVKPPPDTTTPDLKGPRRVSKTTSSTEGTEVDFTVTASDDRDGSVPVTCEPGPGSVFEVGTTNVICTARDNAGNEGKHALNVVVTYRKPKEPNEP
jgi:hypothetical protein